MSFADGKEISRGSLSTAGAPAAIRLSAEKASVPADGVSLVYVPVEIVDADGALVPDASLKLTASVDGAALTLAGFGSGNPITEENYTKGAFTSFCGKALAILRAGYEPGEVTLTVSGEGIGAAEVTLTAD